MKLFSPRTHGYIDYLADLVLFVAPSILDFTTTPATLCYIIATAHLVMNLVTAYPLGALKWMRFSTHGVVEACLSIALVLLPWIGGFTADVNATPFFVLAGFGLFLVWLTTDYQNSAVRSEAIDFGVRPYTTVKHPGEPPLEQRQAS